MKHLLNDTDYTLPGLSLDSIYCNKCASSKMKSGTPVSTETIRFSALKIQIKLLSLFALKFFSKKLHKALKSREEVKSFFEITYQIRILFVMNIGKE